MIDTISGEKIQVCLDPEQGPFVRIAGLEDCKRLEYLLDAEYFVPYLKMKSPDFSATGGGVYYFGTVADPLKLQVLLDGM
ncbi:hypothetical protein [Pseudomonas soli]|uniref:hypothetical protein n=1 Tax=Pseudomonas soli TaxID=1306993 RepID=UPI0028ADA0BA|nr:hypothetical protein [Pseudomonas soli]